MKHSAWRVCFPAVLMLAMPLAAASGEASKWKVEVTVAMANVRSAPAMTGAIMTKLSRGTVLEAEKAEGVWFKVKLPPDKDGVVKFGYIHQSVVTATEEIEPLPPPPPQPARKPEPGVAPPFKAQPTLHPPKQASAKKFEISLLGGAGVTMVDIPQVLEIDEEYFNDWSKFHWRIAGQAVYRIMPVLGVGFEVGFHSLYYFYYIYPWTSGMNIYRENTITATTVGGLVDFRFGRFFFAQAVAGVSIYSESTLFRLAVALGGEIPIADFLALPVMVRFDLVLGDASPLALVLGLKAKI